jgi:hypothetical protein
MATMTEATMSWSITFHGLNDDTEIPEKVVNEFQQLHAFYPDDMLLALEMAKRSGLSSATCAGGRTPNPYGGDEIVLITVTGMANSPRFNDEMRRVVTKPEEGIGPG